MFVIVKDLLYIIAFTFKYKHFQIVKNRWIFKTNVKLQLKSLVCYSTCSFDWNFKETNSDTFSFGIAFNIVFILLN